MVRVLGFRIRDRDRVRLNGTAAGRVRTRVGGPSLWRT